MIKYGEHVCFNCGEKFGWTLVTLEGASMTPVYTVKGARAKVAHIDVNTLEIDATCTRCNETNRFQASKK